jgi:hypothetical protein
LEVSTSTIYHLPIKKSLHYYVEAGKNHSYRLNITLTMVENTAVFKVNNKNDYNKFYFMSFINTGIMWHIHTENVLTVGVGNNMNLKSLYTFIHSDKIVNNWGLQLSFARYLF